jgi:hypothetical protein
MLENTITIAQLRPSEAVRLWSPTFDWAKSILQSPAWDILSANNPEELESEEIVDAAPKTPAKRKRVVKPKRQPISEADMRRSQRLKKINKGFKSSSCKDKTVLGVQLAHLLFLSMSSGTWAKLSVTLIPKS